MIERRNSRAAFVDDPRIRDDSSTVDDRSSMVDDPSSSPLQPRLSLSAISVVPGDLHSKVQACLEGPPASGPTPSCFSSTRVHLDSSRSTIDHRYPVVGFSSRTSLKRKSYDRI